MKICAVTTWPPHHDGISIYSSYLYEHVSKKAEVRILANITDSSISFRMKAPSTLNHYSVVRCWRRGSVFYPFRIFSRVLKEKPDVIHLQHGWLLYGDKFSSLLFPLLLLLLRLTRRPIIVTMHTVVGKNPRLYENKIINFTAKVTIIFLTKSIVKLSSRIIVHNDLMKKTLRDAYMLRNDYWKIYVIPHGVKEVREKRRKIRGNEYFKMLSFGFIRKGKGIEYLIEAFRIFSISCPKAALIIAGGRHAHDNEEYAKLVKRRLLNDAAENIIFTDFVDEETLDRLIWESEIIILPSLDKHYLEASGSLARVAMYGKPVICSKIPKFEVDLEDGKDCIMVKLNNPRELAEAFSLLTNNLSLREKIGRNLRRKFKDRVWSKVAEQHIHLFKASLKAY